MTSSIAGKEKDRGSVSDYVPAAALTHALKMAHTDICLLIILDENRCEEERAHAMKTSEESGFPIFVPVCRPDGSYVEVQCHMETGYCWCVDREGKPEQGSSVRYRRPRCKKGTMKPFGYTYNWRTYRV